MSISFADSLKKAQAQAQIEVEIEQTSVTPLSLKSVSNEEIAVVSIIDEDNGMATLAEEENVIVAYAGDGWIIDNKYEYYPEYHDDVVSVINDNKTISLISKQINLTQETNSQFIPFEMPRYYDGFDLQTTNIVFYYVNKNKSDGYVRPINVYYNNEKIRFAWLVDKYVTVVAGEVKFEVQAIGVNSRGNEYVWKTKAASLNILESLSGNGTLPDGGDTSSMYRIYERLDSLETEIEDLKYIPIDIESISNNINTVELGSVVNSVIINWKLNKDAINQCVDDNDVDVTLRSVTLDGLRLTTNKSFTLKVTDERDATDIATTGITFMNGVYYGIITDNTEINSEIIIGTNKRLQNGKTLTFNVNAGLNERVIYALPTRYGIPTFTVGGFNGGFSKENTLSFTNESGYVENYDVWLSDNISLGNITVKVT